MKHTTEFWMSKTVFKISPKEDVRSAQDLMRQEVIHHLLVYEDGQLVGLLSHLDLELAEQIKKKFKQTTPAPKITVSDVMTRNPLVIEARTPMKDALKQMQEKRFRSLPVIKGGQIVGILTETDVLKYALIASQCLESDEPIAI
ncbi:MAG: CBS domain-containing protein [Oligoflexia bacterium]|nr:CBS domain-containing protein [Oligoflexia bacterium]